MTDKYIVYLPNGEWVHRHPLKLVFNPILMKIQFFTDRPWLIASRFSDENVFIKFVFARIQLRR